MISPVAGMLVEWISPTESPVHGRFIETLIKRYGKDGFAISSVTRKSYGCIVTLEKEGKLVMNEWHAEWGPKPEGYIPNPLLVNSYYLKESTPVH